MKSYFFIPANNLKFLAKSTEIPASEIVLDLEDSLFNTNVEQAVDNIISLKISKNYYLRPNLSCDLAYLQPLLQKGFNRFVLPKIDSRDQLDDVFNYLNFDGNADQPISLILLIESPLALSCLDKLISHPSVKGAGLGSHDYCARLGMKHTMENLYWSRMCLLNTVKGYEKEVIDIASMNISDEKPFVDECRDGVDKGIFSKFIIHPWQLKLYNETTFYDMNEVDLALKVRDHILELGGEKNFTIAKIDGVIVEKPHLKRFKTILSNSGHGTF